LNAYNLRIVTHGKEIKMDESKNNGLYDSLNTTQKTKVEEQVAKIIRTKPGDIYNMTDLREQVATSMYNILKG